MNALRYSVTQKEQRPDCEKRVSKLFLHSKRFLEFRAQSDRRGKARLNQPERAFSVLGPLWSANSNNSVQASKNSTAGRIFVKSDVEEFY